MEPAHRMADDGPRTGLVRPQLSANATDRCFVALCTNLRDMGLGTLLLPFHKEEGLCDAGARDLPSRPNVLTIVS